MISLLIFLVCSSMVFTFINLGSISRTNYFILTCKLADLIQLVRGFLTAALLTFFLSEDSSHNSKIYMECFVSDVTVDSMVVSTWCLLSNCWVLTTKAPYIWISSLVYV